MPDWHIPMIGIQLGFMAGYVVSFDKGTYDPFGYGFRTLLVVAYTVFSWSRQETYQYVPDWICQAICTVQFISVVINVVSFDRYLWRKDG